MGSKIEWTDETWNPVTGCTKVSPGCDHCYAERITERFHGPGSFAQVRLHEDRLSLPLRWRKPRRVFVNSMSDLFHEDVPTTFIAAVFDVMARTPQHTYQVLTKRHARLRSLGRGATFGEGWPLPNVWLGVSVENQQWADIRIPALLETPAAVRFLSCEPLLGPVDLIGQGGDLVGAGIYALPDPPEHDDGEPVCIDHGAEQCRRCRFVDWVIAGGESGPGARPMHPDWVRSLRDQCEGARVPFFFKQAGAVLAREWGCTDRTGHNPADWPEPFPREYPNVAWDQYPVAS